MALRYKSSTGETAPGEGSGRGEVGDTNQTQVQKHGEGGLSSARLSPYYFIT